MEVATAALVAKRLEEWGYEVTRGIGGHGVVGRLRIGEGKRSVSLRADMDALPITEATGVAHAKARRAVFRALGEFREARAADALLNVVNNGDASYYAEAWATAALGKTRDPRAFEALERSLGQRRAQLGLAY